MYMEKLESLKVMNYINYRIIALYVVFIVIVLGYLIYLLYGYLQTVEFIFRRNRPRPMPRQRRESLEGIDLNQAVEDYVDWLINKQIKKIY